MILVTGATGNVSRPLVDELLTAGAKVRGLTRNPDTANLPADVDVARSSDLPMDGVTSIFFVLNAFPDGPAELIARATEHGVRRIVALSSSTVLGDDPKNMIAVKHRDLEQQIVDSGLEYTFLRADGGLAITALEWSAQIRTTRTARSPYGRAQTAPLHENDIAEVAARALLTDDLVGAKPVFSGPESLSYADRARIIGEAIGSPVTFEELSDDEAREEWARVGIPPHAIEARLRMFAGLVDRPYAVTSVEPWLGRPGRTFATWAADHVADFR